MSFITKNANSILLLLLIISSAALIGATIFFQLNFERINDEYNYKLSELQKVSTELETHQELLNKIKSELSVKTAREQEFSEKYTDIRTTKETLETQKQKLTAQKEELTSDLQKTATELTSTKAELESKKDRIDTLETELTELEDDYDACIRIKNDLEDDLEACNCTS